MAEILGYPDDAAHWNETVGMEGLNHTLETGWQIDTEGMYGATSGGIGFGNLANAANSAFPRDWVVTMAEMWMDDSVGLPGVERLIVSHLVNAGERFLRICSPD